MRVLAAALFVTLLTICRSASVTDLLADSVRSSFLQRSILVLYSYKTACDTCIKEKKIFSDIVNTSIYEYDPLFMNNDCSVNPRVCRYYHIDKFPSVLILNKNGVIARYTGSLESSSFPLFLSQHLNKPTGLSSLSTTTIRIVLLSVILIALVYVFLKTTKKPEVVTDVEEHAPLVEGGSN